MKLSRILLGGSAVAALLYGGSYLLKINRLSNEIGSETKVSIHKISLAGIELAIRVTLKNPSGGSIRVKHPFVKIFYGGSVLASSQIKDINIEIAKFSQTEIDPIIIKLGFLSLATTVPALMKEYRESGKLNLTLVTVTTVNDNFPYTKTDNITLGGGKAA